MFGFGRRQDPALLALRAENSDLRQTLREERIAWAVERQALVDRIVALASPAVFRELRRPVSPSQPPPNTTGGGGKIPEWRPNFPGVEDSFKDPDGNKGDKVLDEIVAALRAERGTGQ